MVENVTYEKLHFNQREMQTGFPEIPFMKCIGIMFQNTLYVNENNHFQFALKSNDGTILWLNDKEMINNDFSNGTPTHEDTFYLVIPIVV